eukprot:TRINITY_DN1781_c0_g1_i5.p1 TRINITY_DN1781_c0_g1~~TRINITY_DN1781_c0_g1_i5.p1  ORF type:complete len:499 (-),score=25.51 TRINITY_DN1781_c0_g1_i5:115-1611(-)
MTSLWLLLLLSAAAATYAVTLPNPGAGVIYVKGPDPFLVKPSWTRNYTAPDIPINFGVQNGTNIPEQIHLYPATHDFTHLYVQWITPDTVINQPLSVSYGRSPAFGLISTATPTQYTWGVGTPTSYTSGKIYSAVIGPLKPSTKYYYQIETHPATFSFTTLPAVGATKVRIGLMADVGQTFNSSLTYDNALLSNPNVLLFVGDLNYADNYSPPCQAYAGVDMSYSTCGIGGLRWDSWGRLSQKLFSKIPVVLVPGNHELELVPEVGEVTPFKAYTARIPALVDQTFPHGIYRNLSKLPLGGTPGKSPEFYSVDIGPVHVIGASSYSAFVKYTHQWYWLMDDLCSIDHSITPWVIVVFHQPYYNTDNSHYLEGEPFRTQFEDWFYNATVDLVVAGHVHAYERHHPTYKYSLDKCGPTYITVGDGGNTEGVAGPFLDPMPVYSAYREYSFGHAVLEVMSPMSAVYTWYRNQNGQRVEGDRVVLTNKASLCGPKKPSFCPP